MPALSPKRKNVPVLPGLTLLGRGKVRDSYELDNNNLLICATDAISIFDFVLNALVPEKGMVLAAMSHFWLKLLENDLGIKTHLVAAGAQIDDYLPPSLRGKPELQSRAMVVNRLKMADVEFVVRGYLTGSGLKSYNATGAVCGILLPIGLQDGDQLIKFIATPTTKSQEGHDEALDAAEVRERFSKETDLLFKIYAHARQVAREHGIIIADTKFEFGRDERGRVVLGDEALTADSSRFWDANVWAAGRKLEKRKAPPPFDKQLVREWGIEQGINKLDPLKPDDVERAQAFEVPQELIAATTQTYRYIFWRLTGMKLETYLRDVLGVVVPAKKRRLTILFGSKSDIPHVQEVLHVLSNGYFSSSLAGRPKVHVLSCHRNPYDLLAFAAGGCRGADAVVVAGSKAFALPGVLDALTYHRQKNIPVIGVALGEPGSVELEAAKLSISEIPGQPVVMDEMQGRVYEGYMGFAAAVDRVAKGEFPVPKKRVEKSPEFDIDISAL